MQVSRSKLLGGGVALLAAVGVLVLWPRHPVDAKTLIERKVVNMTHAAEEKDLGFIMEQISDRFRTSEGWGKPETKQVLAAQVFRGSWVRVFVTDLEVNVTSPTTADLSAKFVFGRSDAKVLKDLAKDSVMDAQKIDAKLEKESDGEWRFVSASHASVDPSTLF